MALAGAFLWGRAALLPSCYFVSRTGDYTNYASTRFKSVEWVCWQVLKAGLNFDSALSTL
jgi:hypothetical protein